MLTFDDKDHIYRWNGEISPSVTQVIGEWREIVIYGVHYFVNVYSGDVISAERLRVAQEFGKAVHKAAFFLLKGTLDWDSLASELISPLKEIQRWASEHSVRPVLLETPLHSTQYAFSGTPDFVGYLRRDKHLSVVDYGTGAFGMKGPQTAAYVQLYREYARDLKPIKRYVLHAPKTGAYSLIPQENPHDWLFFVTKLNEKKYLTQKGVCKFNETIG
jgi:hypothetical protein